jgi:glycosyltransferase involved in cell wall biosynthesis
MELSVVVPAYNEEASIAGALDHLATVLRGLSDSFEIIVVNDGSKDATLALARAAAERLPEVRVVDNEVNQGQVESILRGFSLARGEILTHNGADLPFDPADTKAILDRMRAGADVVVVERANREAYGIVRKIISRGNVAILRAAFDSPVHDHNFTQGYRRAVLQRIPVQTWGVSTVTPELIIKAHKLGFRVESVTCRYHRRERGQSSIGLRAIVDAGTQLTGLWLALRRGDAERGRRVVP